MPSVPRLRTSGSDRSDRGRIRPALALAAVAVAGAGLLITPMPSASAATVGDNFASPRTIARSTGVDTLSDTTGFTAEVGEPNHFGRPAVHSVWYRWQSPVTGQVTFRTQGTAYDTVMSAYTGSSLTSLNLVIENDDTTFADATNRQSQVHFDAVAGTTYMIAVDSFQVTGFGPVTLSWDANDSFGGATPLTGPAPGATVLENANNTGATKETGEPRHAGFQGGHSVWFSWKAPSSGQAHFDTLLSDVQDTLLAAYTGSSVNGLTQIAANDDINGTNHRSALSFPAVKDTVYRIAVDSGHFDDPSNPVPNVSPDQGPVILSYSLAPTPVPAVSVADVSITEGNTGTKQANVTVKLSAAASTPVSVTAGTSDGSAKAGSDYVATNATVVIPKGATSATFPVKVVGDTGAEAQEQFTVSLGAVSGATISDGSATVTVNDNDGPKLSVLDATVTEGNSGTKNLSVTVKASKASTQQLTALFSTVNGAATSGPAFPDFVAVSNRQIVFAPGQTSRTTTVEIVGDTGGETEEDFSVTLTNPTGGAVIGDATGVVRINDNDII